MTATDVHSERASVATGFVVRSAGLPRGRTVGPWWSWSLVAGAVAWGLVSLAALTRPVAYANDSSVHEQMVRFATARLRAGHLPLTSWFPYLGEGSPQFLHYQSLPAMVTGAVGLLVGPDAAFRWALYLLLACWPVSVYLSARWFGASRPAAAASAAVAPFLVSVPGVGYEQHAYVWSGYGVWTQLWAMWTLPLAWGLSWRAVRDGRGYAWAVLATAATVALHFETGYLALAVLVVWPLAAGRPWRVRLRRAGLLLAGSLLASAWVIVPLLSQREWAAVNEPLQHTALVDGYGALKVIDWLVSGAALDHGRLPVVTVLAGVGFGLAWLAFSTDGDSRALLVALGLCLVLTFGRATWGSVVDVIPGGRDLFFRRFMMGAQLVAILLAGRGAAWIAGRAAGLVHRRVRRWPRTLTPAVGLLAAVAALYPAWHQLDRSDRDDDAQIAAQQRADRSDGAEVDRLSAIVERNGDGRVYAGRPDNWGAGFAVGQVPVVKYLESRDVDEVGYTLRTASLMTQPEYYFDDRNPSDDRLFGVRYLMLPLGDRPPRRLGARAITAAGPYTLWRIRGGGYLQAGRVVGRISADRTDIGTASIPVLHSALADHGDEVSVDYPARRGRLDALAAPAPGRPAGTVAAERVNLPDGRASATVRMRRPGVAVLSASDDAGWTATVDGRPRSVRMVAPALAAVDVPAGVSRVAFRYRGYRHYPELLALAAVALLATAIGPALIGRRRRRRRRRGPAL